MASITYKEPTLNGAADIVMYANRDCYYLRIKRAGKRYSMTSLKTQDIDVARKNSIDSYLEIMKDPPKRRTNRKSFLKACEEYLEHKHQQAQRKQITAGSASSYEQRIYQRIIPFAKVVGVNLISDIKEDCFSTYRDYFLDVKTKGKWNSSASGLSPSTINSDICTLKELLKFLVKKKQLDFNNIGEIPRARDRTNYREESNPAFFPAEWRKMCDVLYQFDQNVKDLGKYHHQSDEEVKWKRRWFINYIRFMYQLGGRPHEVAKIRLGDCRLTELKDDDGKLKKYGFVHIRPDTKRGKRDSVMNGNTLQKVQSHLKKGIKMRNEQIKEVNKKIKEEYANRDAQWLKRIYSDLDVDVKQVPLMKDANHDDLLMMNPFLKGKRKRMMYHSEHIRKWWNEILEQCNFNERYTLYSLRSTHITFNLLQKRPINMIADNCGTSSEEINRTYKRVNNILNMKELGFFKSTNLAMDDELIIEPLLKPE
mgnify:FL=1